MLGLYLGFPRYFLISPRYVLFNQMYFTIRAYQRHNTSGNIMINWEETEKQLNRTDLSGTRPRVITQCDKCQTLGSIQINNKSKITNNQLSWICQKCKANDPIRKEKAKQAALQAWQNPNYRQAITQNSKENWEDEELKARMSAFRNSPDFKQRMDQINKTKKHDKKKLSAISKQRWQDPTFRSKQISRLQQYATAQSTDEAYKTRKSEINKRKWQDKEYRKMITEATIELWQDPEYKDKMQQLYQSEEYKSLMSKTNKEVWTRPGHKEKMIPILNKIRESSFTGPTAKLVSTLATTLYSILDDLGIKYYREYDNKPCDPECKVGPYQLDCVIQYNGKIIAIEVQGDYWHSLPQNIIRDKAKATYIQTYFPHIELKYIWEHEFIQKDRIKKTIKYWLGLQEPEQKEFQFNDLNIKPVKAEDYKLLLSKYHYLANGGRGGIAYGAYLNDTIIAVCIFSPLGRQNIAQSLNCAEDNIRELSRLCIHPSYQKKNLASWLISRCIRSLPDKYTTIISYCDTTFNHTGAIYKAANFKHDSTTQPDYWYINSDKWVIHKKTLYNKATQLKMKEREYAEKYGFTRVYGKEKLRFVYKR